MSDLHKNIKPDSSGNTSVVIEDQPVDIKTTTPIDVTLDEPIDVKITDGTETADVVTATDDDTNLDGLNGLVTNSISNFRISDTIIKPARMDAVTHATQTLDYEHHEIHDGSAFVAWFETELTETGDQGVIAFNTPDTTKWGHIIMAVHTSNYTRFYIAENTSIDVDEGTQKTIYNRNRNSSNTSVMLSIETTPVANETTTYTPVQAAGANITTTTILDSVLIGSPGKGASGGIGGIGQARFEFMLEQNQQYAFIAENVETLDNNVSIQLDWYEHISKD